MNPPATKKDAQIALNKLKGFIGPAQIAAVKQGIRGEEQQFFFDKLVELATLIEFMPQTGEQDGKGDEAMIYLHYFAGGQANFYIIEKDKGCAGDTPEQFQSQAFGLADLFGDGGEWGYISIPEILANGGELDFYFKPCTMVQLRSEKMNNFNLQWVVEGVLARSNRPCYWDDTTVVGLTKWLDKVATMKIKSILCLLSQDELDKHYGSRGIDLLAMYRDRGFRVRHVPVSDHRQPPLKKSDLVKIHSAFCELPMPCLIHCSAGIDRTGAAVHHIQNQPGLLPASIFHKLHFKKG